MKKLINHPNDVVTDMLTGLAKSDRSLRYLGSEYEVVCRAEKTPGKVGLVSGGGSGHEPAHAGYVGRGMLDAAVAGNVFASPSPDRIIEGIKAADDGAGVLLIVKNYSGDIMNFQMAAELAEFEDIRVETVVVRDDVAVADSTYSTGRRGIAGTVFVHKLAGAAAEAGKTLDEVKTVAQKVIDNVRSMGMAMTPCTLPGVGKPGFRLDEDEMELGMGIHGEPGICRERMRPASEIASLLLEHILADKDYTDSDVAVMVNGLGGTPLMELYIVFNEVEKLLAAKGIRIYRSFVGNFMTSLEMSGCSVTLLKLDDEMKSLLDAPACTPAFHV